MNTNSYWKLEIDGKSQSRKKSKCWLLTLKIETLTALYSNVIWILEKWMWIHVWEVKISQGRQNG